MATGIFVAMHFLDLLAVEITVDSDEGRRGPARIEIIPSEPEQRSYLRREAPQCHLFTCLFC